MEETGPSDLQVQHEEDPIDYMYMYQEPYEDVIWNSNEGSQPLLSQFTDTMISQLDAQLMLCFCHMFIVDVLPNIKH
jgi:hypothetical protein